MGQLEGSFVTTDAKLPLELERRHARRLRRHQVGGPEPDVERQPRRVEDGSRGERGLFQALATTEDPRPRCNALRLPNNPTGRAGKALGPSKLHEIVQARSLVGEEPLKVEQSLR